MKLKTYICNGLFTSLAFLFFNCSDNSSSAEKVKMASVPKGFVSSKDIGDAITVKEFRESNQTNTPFIVEGFIGGRKKPFSQNRAVFILGDNSLETCDEIPGDSCPTPWDVCCEDRNKIASSTISIQVLDSNGSHLIGTLEGVSGLRPGKKVKVRGSLNENSAGQAFIMNATSIHLISN